jgi:hypothetical protein
MILFPLFATGVVDTGGKFTADTAWWCTLPCQNVGEFLEKFEMTLTLFLGTWWKIHEKT